MRQSNELRIQLAGFDGPLDLLLHLIKKHELDIFDIPISFITEEYLAYIDAMRQLDLALAGEYLVMAATLVEIKSKMLLPKREDENEAAMLDEVFQGDPREALVRRLLEYQCYRSASVELGSRETVGRDVFTRPPRPIVDDTPADLVPIDIFQLIEAFREVIKDRPAEALHEITPSGMSLREAINRVVEHLETTPRATLLDLIYVQNQEPTRGDVIVTFLALLEMAKLRLIRLFQSRLSSSELFVERAVMDYDEVAQTLENVDVDAEFKN